VGDYNVEKFYKHYFDGKELYRKEGSKGARIFMSLGGKSL